MSGAAVTSELTPQPPPQPRSPAAAPSQSLSADTLAGGIFLLLAFTVSQRLVGFVRGILFCRILEPAELGMWDLAFSFLLLAAPLVVLGLPGSFGRYAERFRARGRLQGFLGQTTLVCVVLSVGAAGGMLLFPATFSWLIFDSTGHETSVRVLAGGLVAAIAFNFLVSLFTALRQMRVVAGMQFFSSLTFALFGVGLVLLWRASFEAVIIAYFASCAVCSLGAGIRAWGVWRNAGVEEAETEKAEADEAAPASLWARLLPFAAWVWLANLMGNLFEVADRYMIIHSPAFSKEAAAVMVGNYHSSRIVPLLMVSVAGLLGSTVLPHLVSLWERGRRDEVSDQLNAVLKLSAVVLLGGSVAVLLAAPLLFGWAFGGKYDGGLAVLPWTLVYCIWFGLGLIGQGYMWCAEKAKLSTLLYTFGLIVNIALNVVLLPLLGLQGAVLATAAGNATCLALAYVFNAKLGMQVHAGTWILAAAPLVLTLGTWPALAAWLLIVIAAWKTEWILTTQEKTGIADFARAKLSRLR